jgi:hypothetical protein
VPQACLRAWAFHFTPRACSAACAEELLKAIRGDGTSAFIPERKARLGLLLRLGQALQQHKFSGIGNRVHRINPVLEALDGDLAGLEVDVLPLDVREFTDAKAVVKGHQDHALIPILVARSVAQRLTNHLDFPRRQVAFAPEFVVGLA